MNVFELAMKYYPQLWNKERIETLYRAGKITQEEYEQVIGKEDEQ